MKKIISILLIIIGLVSLSSCDSATTSVSDDSVDVKAMPIETFGNQGHNREDVDYFLEDDSYIYKSKKNSIFKFNIDKPEEETLVYEDNALKGIPKEICKYKEWIYFKIESEDYGYLYRVKEDGSQINKLLDSVSTYVLTKENIYYGTFRTDDTSSLNVMNLDGSNTHKLLDSELLTTHYRLLGLDNGWIYYSEYNEFPDEEIFYRMTKEGDVKENVFDVFGLKFDADNDVIYDFIVDKNFIAYVHDGKTLEKKELVIKNKGGRKMKYEIEDTFERLNKEGDWLYYMDWDKVYKLNVTKRGKKQLVYDFNINSGTKNVADSIQLHNGNALLTMNTGNVYIKSDGTITELRDISTKDSISNN